MQIDVRKSYTTVHTWTGVISGMLLYIAFIAGALTMFKSPLNQWALQKKTMLPAIPADSYDQLILQVLRTYPEARKELTVHLPAAYPQHAPATWAVEDTETHAVTQWHASLDASGALLTDSTTVSAVGEFIDNLHRTAGIPGGTGHDAIGTYVLGIVSALYFIALISGLVIFLPTWVKDFLTLRRSSNRKRYWLDFHNIFGITSLPFHLMIAWTAFVFAYHDQIYDGLQNVVYGDTPMFQRPPPAKPNTDWNELAPVAQLDRAITALEPDFRLAELLYMRMETGGRSVRLGGTMDGRIVRGAEYNYALSDPYTAEVRYREFLPRQQNGYAAAVTSFFALHFGNFGGTPVRWIYFGLGVTGALIFLSGNILWIESRRKRQKGRGEPVAQTRSSRNIARLTVGVSLGTLIGIGLALIAVKWLPHDRVDIAFWQQAAYYLGFCGSLILSFQQKPMIACRQLLILSIALAGLVAISSFTASPHHASAVGLVSTLLCVALIAIYRKTGLVLRNAKECGDKKDSVWTD